ncbi:MAG: hypothetical protein O2807_08005, partial [bacterium]|nr:hypothetical protein [bacterium]
EVLRQRRRGEALYRVADQTAYQDKNIYSLEKLKVIKDFIDKKKSKERFALFFERTIPQKNCVFFTFENNLKIPMDELPASSCEIYISEWSRLASIVVRKKTMKSVSEAIWGWPKYGTSSLIDPVDFLISLDDSEVKGFENLGLKFTSSFVPVNVVAIPGFVDVWNYASKEFGSSVWGLKIIPANSMLMQAKKPEERDKINIPIDIRLLQFRKFNKFVVSDEIALEKVAAKIYGDSKFWGMLHQMNWGSYEDPFSLEAKQVIFFPSVGFIKEFERKKNFRFIPKMIPYIDKESNLHKIISLIE